MMLFFLLYFRKWERFKKDDQCIKNQFSIKPKTKNTKNSFSSTCKSQNESVIQKQTVLWAAATLCSPKFICAFYVMFKMLETQIFKDNFSSSKCNSLKIQCQCHIIHKSNFKEVIAHIRLSMNLKYTFYGIESVKNWLYLYLNV